MKDPIIFWEVRGHNKGDSLPWHSKNGRYLEMCLSLPLPCSKIGGTQWGGANPTKDILPRLFQQLSLFQLQLRNLIGKWAFRPIELNRASPLLFSIDKWLGLKRNKTLIFSLFSVRADSEKQDLSIVNSMFSLLRKTKSRCSKELFLWFREKIWNKELESQRKSSIGTADGSNDFEGVKEKREEEEHNALAKDMLIC